MSLPPGNSKLPGSSVADGQIVLKETYYDHFQVHNFVSLRPRLQNTPPPMIGQFTHA